MADGSLSLSLPSTQHTQLLHRSAPATARNSSSFAIPSTFLLRLTFPCRHTAQGPTLRHSGARMVRLIGTGFARPLAKHRAFNTLARLKKGIDRLLSSPTCRLFRPILKMCWQVQHSSFIPELRGDYGSPFANIVKIPPSSGLVKRLSCIVDASEHCLKYIPNWFCRRTLSWSRIRGSLQDTVTDLNIRDHRAQWRSKGVRQAIQVGKNKTAAAGIECVHLSDGFLKQTMRCRFLFQKFQASAQINRLAREVGCGNESLSLSCFGSPPPIKDPRQKTHNQGNERSRGCRNSTPVKNTRFTQRIAGYPSGPIHVHVTPPCAVSTFCHASLRTVKAHG